jgi:hypothetical protein
MGTLRKRSGLAVVRLIALLTTVLTIVGGGTTLALSPGRSVQDLTVTANFVDRQSVFPNEEIVFTLSRLLRPGEGRISVLIGSLDVSSLLTNGDNTFEYSPRVVPLPMGETPVYLYLVDSANTWREIAHFTLRVESSSQSLAGSAGPSASAPTGTAIAPIDSGTTRQGSNKQGFDRSTITPTFTIGMKSQATESHFPDSNRPPRPTFADLTLQGGVRSDIAKGGFASQTQFDIVGTSFRNEALRFGQEQQNAPLIDLASYVMQFQLGQTKVTVGHLAFGSNQHLINNFSSRGISIVTPLSKFVDVGLAAMNGTSIVGWSNFFGLAKKDHQFVTGTAGVEFKPEHRGELRFEFSALDGRLQPLSSFNQGNINDVERSHGFALRFVGADPAQRWRFDSGFTRSTFTNPPDPLLSQGFSVVPVKEATANASYADGAFNIVQNVRLTEAKRAIVNLHYRFEEVDPLFKSVAAFTQPDRLQNQIDVVANIGDLTATVTHLRFSDNLSNVPSVLKSLSRRTGVILGTPLSSLFGNPSKPSPWLPRVSYSFDDVHQFGASIPVNGGFEVSPSTIPDQVSTNQSLSADWQVNTVRWGYRFNRSFQDNRQLERELADFRNTTNAWTVGLQPSPKIGFNLEISWNSAVNKEQKRTDHTLRVGPSINWVMSKSMILTASYSATRLGNLANTSRSFDGEADIQWSYRLAIDKGKLKKVQAQFFVRYANRYAFSRDTLFGFDNLTKIQSLNAGISFTFF